MGSIVVGVDGSQNSIAALRWAAEQAARTGSDVRAVAVWDFPYGALSAGPLGAASPPPQVDLQDATEEMLDESLRAAALPDDVTVNRVVRQGAPATVLLDEAKKGADLIVVGARGRGGFVGLLIGSVATQVVNHATIPTVVVRAPEE